ncbi:hypothetical protein Tco_0662408 [Tanacetum coccineum]
MFVDFRTELVEGSSKRAGEELEQESTKKLKVDEDKYTAKFQSLIEVIPDEEEVEINVVPLATKSPSIVDLKIHKEGKKSYYQIVRADRKSQMYRVFSQMLKSFTREDLKDLYRLVKAKYESTRPVEDLDLVLWNDLKAMFEPHVEDEIWKLQQRVNAASKEVSTVELVSTVYVIYMRYFVTSVVPLIPTFISGEGSLIVSSSRTVTVSGQMINPLAVCALYSARAIMVKLALVAQR